MNRLSSDTTKLQDAATTNVSMFLRSTVSLFLSIVLLFITSWKLTLVALAVVPAIVVGATVFGKFMKKLSKRYQDALAKASEVSQESISNVRTMRSFAAERVEFDRYSSKVGNPDDTRPDISCWRKWVPKEESSYKLGVYKALGYGAFAGGMSLTGYLAVLCVLWYGGSQVIAGKMTTGDLIAFVLCK